VWSRKVEGIAPNVDAGLHLYHATATITLFPGASSGLFVKGGIGASLVDIEFKPNGRALPADLGKGVGFVAGAGYDVPLGGRVSLTPALNVWFGQIGDVNVAQEHFVGDWTHNAVEITLGLTFH
jgi:hypothetical protein